MKTGSSPVLANQKSKEGDWLPKTQHFYFGVKAEGCSASFACSVEREKKRLVRTAAVLCGEVSPAG